jgi:tetratricopeptide (TPR) repeat protein
LMFGRPELVEGRAGFGSGRNRTALWLDPLDATSMDGLVDALVPGMPATARASITAQARGIPLFAVETIRSLIDREIVAPHEGMYRLVGDVGALTVPDSLHALLAARLDSLEPPIRDLVADASVIGSTFPAEAVIAISDQDERAVRAGLTELVRRDVLEVSSDPLSPQLGTYRFGQDMLRQVAYDTLGRRDRKTRHLTVAAHLRAVFAGDGEEVADVIARHYLDALDVATGDPDTAEIRELAIGMLTRAADRSERTGAPHPAAQSYALAAEQTELAGKEASAVNAAILWEKAGKAARDAADFESAIAYAERAQDHYTRLGMIRAGARAQTAATHALQAAGRRREARERLIAALVVLRPDPDVDTVRAIDGLATNETFSGGPDADRLSTEALVLGQALDVDSQLLITLLVHRGICLYFANRPVEATAHLEHGLKIAERSGDSSGQGGCLGNLSEILVQRDPIAAAAAAHAAEEHARRVGNVDTLTFALGNEASALIFGGNWDAAETLLHHARETGQIESFGYLAGLRAELAALRGDASTASDLAADPRLRASEDAQDQALVELCEALIALALNDPVATLAHAQAVIAYAPTLGIGFLLLSWAWPLAARTAHDLGDTGTTAELLAVLDAHPIGHLPPLLRAERALARARIASTESNGADALTAAVAELRKAPSPYHRAHGLLDQAQHHVDSGDQEAAGPLIEEARSIATTLRCPPLLQRADDMAGPDHTRRPNEETGSVYVDTP